MNTGAIISAGGMRVFRQGEHWHREEEAAIPSRKRLEVGQTEERIGAPELTDANGVGCAMRPRPAKDEEVRPEDPEQVKGVSDGW